MSAVLATPRLSTPHASRRGSHADLRSLADNAAPTSGSQADLHVLIQRAAPMGVHRAPSPLHTVVAARALALTPELRGAVQAPVPLNVLQLQTPAANVQVDLERALAPHPSQLPQIVADCMWYLGHMMSLGGLASRYDIAAAACLVVIAQILTMASRPVGRINQNHTAHLLCPQTAQDWADIMWYFGHVLSVFTLLSRYSIIAAALLGLTAQTSTVASRFADRLTPGTPRLSRNQKLADVLWCVGHFLSLGSLLARYNIIAAACCATSGQVSTMMSRPMARAAQTQRGRSDDTH